MLIERSEGEITKRLEEKDELVIVFVHTPLCGTCKRAASMLTILEQTYEELEINQLNINQYPSFAQTWQIQSVPCLLIFQKGLGVERRYAFQSIPALHSLLQPYTTNKISVTTTKGE